MTSTSGPPYGDTIRWLFRARCDGLVRAAGAGDSPASGPRCRIRSGDPAQPARSRDAPPRAAHPSPLQTLAPDARCRVPSRRRLRTPGERPHPLPATYSSIRHPGIARCRRARSSVEIRGRVVCCPGEPPMPPLRGSPCPDPGRSQVRERQSRQRCRPCLSRPGPVPEDPGETGSLASTHGRRHRGRGRPAAPGAMTARISPATPRSGSGRSHQHR